MGKIRVATLGSDEEKEQQEKQRVRREEKKKREAAGRGDEPVKKKSMYEDEIAQIEEIARHTQKSESGKTDEEVEAETSASAKASADKGKKESKDKARKHSKKYLSLQTKVDRNKVYALSDALELLRQISMAKFGGAVEIHINTIEKGLRGNVQLPHGTGKEVRVEVATADTVDAIVEKISAGKLEFDALVAHPSVMSKLARVAKILGPRGLMPNPKNGTVSPKPQEVADKLKGGEINWKTESEFPIIHQVIGRMAFSDDQLQENFRSFIKSVGIAKIKNATIKSTMSPGIKVQI